MNEDKEMQPHWQVDLTASYTQKTANRIRFFQLPLRATFEVLGMGRITVDWGDGTVERLELPAKRLRCKHDYARLDSYSIRVVGGPESELQCLDLWIGPECAKKNHCCYTSLRIDRCKKLFWLYCHHHEIEELDLAGCPKLEELYCQCNRLQRLDLRPTRSLRKLACELNPIEELDLSPCPQLRSLALGHMPLTQLDVKPCGKLEELICESSPLTTLRLGRHPKLKSLWCRDSRLTKLELGGCPALKELVVYNNRLTRLDLTANRRIANLSCFDNRLTKLKIGKKRPLKLGGKCQLKNLNCRNNRLTELDLSSCSKLVELDCTENAFSPETMERLYGTLPTRSAEGRNDSEIRVDELSAGDISMAEKRGWKVALRSAEEPLEEIEEVEEEA